VRDLLQGNPFELVNREVERFGGTTEMFVGDESPNAPRSGSSPT
jgi:hypothetical protein